MIVNDWFEEITNVYMVLSDSLFNAVLVRVRTQSVTIIDYLILYFFAQIYYNSPLSLTKINKKD